jgi:hypothetical protein
MSPFTTRLMRPTKSARKLLAQLRVEGIDCKQFHIFVRCMLLTNDSQKSHDYCCYTSKLSVDELKG